MACLARVDKEGWSACAGKGGRHFSGNMAGFAHAHDHDFPPAVQHQITGFGKRLIDILLQPLQGGNFDLQNPTPGAAIIEQLGHSY